MRAVSEPGSDTAVGPSYAEHRHWLRYQEFFPSGLSLEPEPDAEPRGSASRRLAGRGLPAEALPNTAVQPEAPAPGMPVEEWWSWRGRRVHLDRIARLDAPAKVIALHGIGGYGRMLTPYGRLPALADLEFLAPDLPGFGLTSSGLRNVTYAGWLRCVTDLVAAERRTDQRPVVLMGVGSAGRLAYDVAARAGAGGSVAGVLVTGLADPRRDEVRRMLATTPEVGRWSGLLGLLPGSVPMPLPPAWAPVRWLVNIAAMSNHAQFAHAIWADPLAGGNWMSLGFLRSYLVAAPAVEPEDYAGPPVLLAHPAEDRWSPPRLSQEFFDRLGARGRFAELNGAGHLPTEESGLADLDRAVRDYVDELGLT
ncbi:MULTISPECIES: alpha/beta hydrolase [unclassified Saccharopolyspora]|uniref:alpha/beta hydrolase n=1 Tax=unclassified Saccharopolyspora TaxID=2646250 RepID=UPI001CD1FB66|nr:MULTISPECIES: alpha/beta hydrolase [unclassified Saccharopolyspora]MCA1187750.1 alpha/beta hydrolase [Saccharopolyspora sp. 6T]MCA1225938.1 alpha/beta hydrolase [Saccharopolyspora sp. 6M]MCA1278657.1 alpha/beta hydrolase [Saccharopolyspora sp. 7B]